MDEKACPKCGEDCHRESADVGVGVIYGPWGCPACGWSSDSEYDRSGGPSPAQLRGDGSRYVDQFGCSYSIDRIAENLGRFGISRGLVEDVFREGTPEKRV